MLLPKEMIINDADRFSDQLSRLQEALHKANEAVPVYVKPAYSDTGVPNCSPASSAIN
jgi:hypothetical protein